ncbi:hypothetical protein VIGAN_08369400 [Vigna angularis var. angularis]|uniref:Uncharacterized protein n=1 Tax=Vigna angularis var. angularis TaxID=157739 RepID=A0A0S3SV29_PHAAN|nr:hypothetical protein VIGAN_08369400 [Vigna angularis var. angularis]
MNFSLGGGWSTHFPNNHRAHLLHSSLPKIKAPLFFLLQGFLNPRVPSHFCWTPFFFAAAKLDSRAGPLLDVIIEACACWTHPLFQLKHPFLKGPKSKIIIVSSFLCTLLL